MIRLIAKECRQLLPIGCLWMAVLALGYAVQFFIERVDEETFGSWCEVYCDYNSDATVAIISIVFALVTAYSLFPREHDDATIDFLRALPVSRGRLFAAKVLAAWLLLCFITGFSYAIDALLLSTNPESIGGTFYWQVWVTLLWRDCLFALIILSHGVLLSWFRTLGLIIYGLYLVGLMWAESYLGTSGDWSIFSLLSNEYFGSTLIVNSRALMIHTAVALLLFYVAYLLWSRTDSSASGVQRSSRAIRVFNVIFTISGFSVLALLLFDRVERSTSGDQVGSLNVLVTDYYRFVYDSGREDVARYIADHADDDFEQLGAILGVEELPRVRVDLSASNQHAAGLAKWKNILMDLDSFQDDISQRRVLSHESAHVLQSVESDRALAANHAASKFFIEGMAQYVSFVVVPETERRSSNWELASVSWQRQKIRFDDLIDSQGFAERFDAELHYSLGDLWTKAFVDECGVSVLGDFIRATGRKEALRDLPAALFWRDTTQNIECDLDTVNVTWRQQMSALYEQVDQAKYPVFKDIVVTREDATGQIIISAALESFSSAESEAGNASQPDPATSATNTLNNALDYQLPERFVVRVGAIASQLGGGIDPVYRGKVTGSGDALRIEFVVPSHAIQGTRFRYQLGFAPAVDSRNYYERWRRGTVAGSASES